MSLYRGVLNGFQKQLSSLCQIHTSAAAMVLDRTLRLRKQIDRRTTMLGIEGADDLSVGPQASLGAFPTLETMNTEFYGTPYKDLPILIVACTKNNTKAYLHTSYGKAVDFTTCGGEGFKNCKKGTQVAGQAVGLSIAVKALKAGMKCVRVQLRGLGPGRSAILTGLSMTGLKVASITDITSLKELGTRPKKQRRV